jgi:FkbM family methyltransferase
MRHLLKQVAEVYVNFAASLLGFSFPEKYGVRWKLAMLLGRYEPETTRCVSAELKRGDTFIDIGAHIGYFSRLAARKVGAKGRVIAFEPDHDNFILLEKNTARHPQIKRVRDAVSNVDGRIPFYHVRGSTGCHSTIPVPGSSGELIYATTLDEYIAKNGITKVTMIKMDIEGGEWRALNGMEKTLASPGVKLILEYNPEALERSNIHPHDLLRRLFASGFSLYLLLTKDIVPLSPSECGTIDESLVNGSVNIYCTRHV